MDRNLFGLTAIIIILNVCDIIALPLSNETSSGSKTQKPLSSENNFSPSSSVKYETGSPILHGDKLNVTDKGAGPKKVIALQSAPINSVNYHNESNSRNSSSSAEIKLSGSSNKDVVHNDTQVMGGIETISIVSKDTSISGKNRTNSVFINIPIFIENTEGHPFAISIGNQAIARENVNSNGGSKINSTITFIDHANRNCSCGCNHTARNERV